MGLFNNSTLVDAQGRPLPSGELRQRAEAELREFIEANKGKFEQWFRQHGPVRPPIAYDTDRARWFWIDGVE